jgi:putative flippase GtrA
MIALLRQSLRFAAVGVMNTAAGLGAIYAAMFFFHIGPALANACGYVIGLTVSFALNRVWTFNHDRPITLSLPKFLLAAGLCYTINLGATLTTISCFSGNPYLAQLLGVGLYAVTMFSACRWFVFTSPQAETTSSEPPTLIAPAGLLERGRN